MSRIPGTALWGPLLCNLFLPPAKALVDLEDHPKMHRRMEDFLNIFSRALLLEPDMIYCVYFNFCFFYSLPFSLQSTPVGTTIFKNVLAQDKDAGVNGLVEYFVVEGSQQNISDISPNTLTAADGYGVFAIAYPHQGQVNICILHCGRNLVQSVILTKIDDDKIMGYFNVNVNVKVAKKSA